MIKGKTKSGFAYELEDDIRDDWDLLALFREADKGDQLALMDAAKQLLGQEQLDRLREHCRKKSGRVSLTKMFSLVSEILDSVGEIKN